MAACGIQDHKSIESRGPQGALRFTPADALARHQAERKYLETVLSMSARQTLSSVLTAARTMPGRSFMTSNSPRLEPARAA